MFPLNHHLSIHLPSILNLSVSSESCSHIIRPLIRYHTKAPLQSLPLLSCHHFLSSLYLTHLNNHTYSLIEFTFSFALSISFFFFSFSTYLASVLPGWWRDWKSSRFPSPGETHNPAETLGTEGWREKGIETRGEERKGSTHHLAFSPIDLYTINLWPFHL